LVFWRPFRDGERGSGLWAHIPMTPQPAPYLFLSCFPCTRPLGSMEPWTNVPFHRQLLLQRYAATGALTPPQKRPPVSRRDVGRHRTSAQPASYNGTGILQRSNHRGGGGGGPLSLSPERRHASRRGRATMIGLVKQRRFPLPSWERCGQSVTARRPPEGDARRAAADSNGQPNQRPPTTATFGGTRLFR